MLSELPIRSCAFIGREVAVEFTAPQFPVICNLILEEGLSNGVVGVIGAIDSDEQIVGIETDLSLGHRELAFIVLSDLIGHIQIDRREAIDTDGRTLRGEGGTRTEHCAGHG